MSRSGQITDLNLPRPPEDWQFVGLEVDHVLGHHGDVDGQVLVCLGHDLYQSPIQTKYLSAERNCYKAIFNFYGKQCLIENFGLEKCDETRHTDQDPPTHPP